jgi:hypothetical protein
VNRAFAFSELYIGSIRFEQDAKTAETQEMSQAYLRFLEVTSPQNPFTSHRAGYVIIECSLF